MASDAGIVNGVYDAQYSQPAELAASTPSHGASASQGSNSASAQQKADPQEIGWYFVEQYYTTLSKSPDKIHLFYNKKSQLITGKEAEKVLPAVGSKAISEKTKSLDISDCKIRVLNVDSQSSYDNIVVQVIGEMSNKSEPHHKFVQTFILATQPNGYFVLNDIFRYLNEDEDEIVEDEPVQEEVTEGTQSAVEPEAQTEPEPEPEPVAAPAEEETVTSKDAVEQVDQKLEAAKDEEESATEDVNGTAEESVAATSEAEPETTVEEPSTEVVQQVATQAEEPLAPEPTPAATPPQATPANDAPPAKKTWASLVGSTKAAALPALPQQTTPAAAPAQPKPQRPAQTAQQPKAPTESITETAGSATSQSNGWQEAGKKTRNQQPKAQEGIVHAYIKNVNDKVDARVLRETLEKYGKLKYYDVSRPKQCAFVEFEDASAYTAAVADNPHTIGTEQINVEERRPRPGQAGGFNNQLNRGGATAGRGGRGGSQQRTGSQGSGFRGDAPRGNFQQRGNKPAGPARGRGQPQAA